jgi:hypothetical protein
VHWRGASAACVDAALGSQVAVPPRLPHPYCCMPLLPLSCHARPTALPCRAVPAVWRGGLPRRLEGGAWRHAGRGDGSPGGAARRQRGR